MCTLRRQTQYPCIEECGENAVYKSGSNWGSFIGITINNLRVGIIAFVLDVMGLAGNLKEGAGASDGVEIGLIEFMESDKPADKTTWFNFDRVTFRTGSAELDPEKSDDQLANIREIIPPLPSMITASAIPTV